MTDRITPRQFRESEGVEDWRVLGDGAKVFPPRTQTIRYRCSSLKSRSLAEVVAQVEDAGLDADFSERVDLALHALGATVGG